MSATLGLNKIKLEASRITTTVQNDNIAKLMYYLDCVLTVIEFDRNNKLDDYAHYYNLNNEERKRERQLFNLQFYSIQIYFLNQKFLL